MPYLIDGNNLMHAVGADVGRTGLCKLLGPLVEAGQRVCVVFDGSSPPPGMAQQIDDTSIEAYYSGKRTADEVICERIAADSAPRRLVVVSSDRQIRAAAHRRRCVRLTSAEFAASLERLVEARHRRHQTEPVEKRLGLSEEQLEEWLREFGL